MPIADIVVPQMGEGLREVRIVSFNKQAGDRVLRDETIYTMETDKALLEVESPHDGTLVEWLAKEDDVLEIGSPIARMEIREVTNTDDTAPPVRTEPQSPDRSAKRNAVIPPRTRKYCKDLGIDDAEMKLIVAPSGKLMPADVDSYLATRSAQSIGGADSSTDIVAVSGIDRELSAQQKLFNYRARRSAQMVIPVTLGRPIHWSGIAALAADNGAATGGKHVTEFQAFAYFAAKSAAKFQKLRSVILTDDKLREYPHVNLGIAVARDNGDLITALVPAADSLPFEDFVTTLYERIHQAREGHDQATPDMQFVLTYLGKHGITDGAPLLMSPAVAILFIGATYNAESLPTVNISLTFDHRLINGVEAAAFLADLAASAESLSRG